MAVTLPLLLRLFNTKKDRVARPDVPAAVLRGSGVKTGRNRGEGREGALGKRDREGERGNGVQKWMREEKREDVGTEKERVAECECERNE